MLPIVISWPLMVMAVAFDVTVSAPGCLFYTTASGTTRTRKNIAPQNTYWDFDAEASDMLSGAEMKLHQGVRIPLPAGNCA